MPLIKDENKQYLTKSTLWLMTIGAGLVVANNYYNQPLLGMIARELGESEAATSKVAMFTQIGYAAGLLLIIPLGDMYRRKRIILIDFVFIIASLLVFALSQSLAVMIAASFFIGLTSVVPQVFVPIAAQLSRPGDKGKNVGIVMSGLLVGILASRVFSGLVGEYLGWREVFYIAAGMMVVMAALIAWLLPDMRPTFSGTYGQLMRSIARYTKDLPALRLASLRGALGFGSFSIFWTTLTFRLKQAPFFQGSDVAGMLGLVGIAGALAASLGGYISGKVNKNILIAISCSLMILSWVIFGVVGSSYIGLIIGIIFIDMGLQGMHVTNQTIVFSSHPEAANRLNTVYMVSYFIGGSLGTLVGGQAWQYYGWTGVVTVGGMFVVLCLVVHLLFCNRLRYK
ncbi:putative MFS family arabinose efflux permease [Dysgonomonas sp. PFB1-18]|uniref:MFS transporter n=1 Tax=unclassified Dysgonomonas TaxID=2630389 RepID=UPI002474F3C5|nr:MULTISPECIES: MFS transporter [unclassified Dysgonomonas]MDH6310787.1 putative MFS family arabinose efflux permease [Dysgonomonas sp. PF1-14]MDH6340637.1 putative MFS family arabinose efflux permease [Dysgonomonas sp. PF1-16]MDH6382256.1 putative MFS family arabinose efflux permease [Dysgonomonas sp. PFB1-18]MDH6399607.1 putative MFS family arabinose efflux permease [Dysgonomonas sp. PF1-23]